jgi:hypothetical protein
MRKLREYHKRKFEESRERAIAKARRERRTLENRLKGAGVSWKPEEFKKAQEIYKDLVKVLDAQPEVLATLVLALVPQTLDLNTEDLEAFTLQFTSTLLVPAVKENLLTILYGLLAGWGSTTILSQMKPRCRTSDLKDVKRALEELNLDALKGLVPSADLHELVGLLYVSPLRTELETLVSDLLRDPEGDG